MNRIFVLSGIITTLLLAGFSSNVLAKSPQAAIDDLQAQIDAIVPLPDAVNSGDLIQWSGTPPSGNWVATTRDEVLMGVDNMQPYTAINFIIATVGVFPTRSGTDPYIGEIAMFGGNFAPVGWKLCNGELLQIAQYTALFSILGTTYGGDGRTTFALPDLRGRVPVHAGSGPGLTNRPWGSEGGSETH